jgi:hypothetical protein
MNKPIKLISILTIVSAAIAGYLLFVIPISVPGTALNSASGSSGGAPTAKSTYERIRDNFHKNNRLTNSDRAELSQLSRESQSYRDLAITLLLTGASTSKDREDIRELVEQGMEARSPIGASLALSEFNATLDSENPPSDERLSARAKELVGNSVPAELSTAERAFVEDVLKEKEFKNRIAAMRILIAKAGLGKDDRAWVLAQVNRQLSAAAGDEKLLLQFVKTSIEKRSASQNPEGVNSHSEG